MSNKTGSGITFFKQFLVCGYLVTTYRVGNGELKTVCININDNKCGSYE